MARSSSNLRPTVPPGPGRSKFDRELLFQRIAIGSVAAVIVAIAAIIGVGYYREVVLKSQEEIARVNSVGFTMDEYIRQLRYRQRQIDSQVQFLNQFGGASGAEEIQQQRSILPTQLVFDWVDEEIIRQNAHKLGISVTADEIDQQMRKDFEPLPAPTPTPGPSPTPVPDATATPVPSPTAVPAPFEERYRNLLQFSGLTDADYRQQIETRLLRERVDAALRAKVEPNQEQIHIRSINVATQEDAQKALDRIRAGETFDAVARDVSLDTLSKEEGGDLGWFPRGVKTKEFDEAAFGLKDNTVAGPLNINNSYYLLQRVEAPSVRLVDSDSLETLKSAALSNWLTEQKAEGVNAVEYKITSDRQLWAQDRIDRETRAEQRRLGQGAPQ